MFTTQNIADTYDQIAPYFSLTRPRLSEEVEKLIPKLHPDDSVLDLGCGNGVAINSLPKGIKYLGIDISQKLIDIAKKEHPRHSFLCHDILDEGLYKDLEKYNLIIALAVFHHLPEIEDLGMILKTLKNHLKTNGTLLISVWNLDNKRFDKYRQGRHLSIPFHGGTSRNFLQISEKELESALFNNGYQIHTRLSTSKNLNLTCTTK